jgi:hypothetical protein
VRRAAPSVAAVVTTVLLGSTALSGCSSDAGAAISPGQEAVASPAQAGQPATAKPASSLAGLIVVPAEFAKAAAPDPDQVTGPFDAESYLGTLSSTPPEDRALLLNATFTQGYQAYRISADKKKRFTVQLFKTGSTAKARGLQQGFWLQDNHSRPFAVPGVPGAMTDARVEVSASAGRSEAIAEASFVVGALVTRISVRQTGDLTADLVPDTTLVASIAKRQRERLTRGAG